MDLFLQLEGTSRKLSPENDTSAGNIVVAAGIGQKTTVDYVLSSSDALKMSRRVINYNPRGDDQFEEVTFSNKIVRDGNAKVHLYFSYTGKVKVQPSILIKDEQDEIPISSEGTEVTTSVGNASAFTIDADFVINQPWSLEEWDLVLRLEVTNDQAGQSSLTLDRTSSLTAAIGEGEIQEIEVFSNIVFKLFQKTEMIFLTCYTDVKEEVTINLFGNVKNQEEVNFNLFQNINVMEEVELVYPLDITINGPYDETDPYLTEVELDDFVLPTWNQLGHNPSTFALGDSYLESKLRKKENLSDLVDRLTVYPPIMVPPTPPLAPTVDYSLSSAADRMVEVTEMLKSEETRRVPGDTMRVFLPGGFESVAQPGQLKMRVFLNKTEIISQAGQPSNVEKEAIWQMPKPYTTGNYYINLGLAPKEISNTRLEENVLLGNTLWALLRQRDVGANVFANYNGQPGKLVLKKEISSTEEVLVWMWSNVRAPFNVAFFAQNDSLQRPGFYGVHAALMVN
jgi:hypothetical protein